MPDRVPFAHPWSEDTIGSKAEVTVGGTPSTTVARYWGGHVPWMSSGDVHLRRISDVSGRITEAGLRASAAKMVEPPAVAIALAGQGKTRGTAALTEIALCTNQSVALITPRDDELDALYLYYALDYRYEELRARSAGGGRAGLTKQIVQNVPVPLPHPNEQSHIAEILNTLDATIRETEAVVAKLRQVKAGLLHDLLTRGLDEHGQLRDPARHPEQFKDSPLGRIPKEWTAEPLGAQITGIEAGHSPSCPGFAASPGEWGVLKVSAVTHEGFVPTENKRIENMHSVDQACQVKIGDLLITRCNTPELVGAACLVDQTPPCLMLCDKTLRLLVNPKRDELRFLVQALQMPNVRWQIEISATGSSGSMKNISQEDIRGYIVPRPSVDEQRRISRRADALLARIAAEQDQHSKLNSLKRGLAHDLLTGRVRVNPFNPVDKS